MTRERAIPSLWKSDRVLLESARFPMFSLTEESVFLSQVGRCVFTSEYYYKLDMFFSLVSNIISTKSDPSLPLSSPKWSAEQEGISAEFSSTSSTSWRGSSNQTLILSMKISLVLIFRSLNPLYYSGYPMKKNSILCGCK